MWIILVYDVSFSDKGGQKRLNKVRKIAKKYVHHIQKSVFEGEITLSNLERLKHEIMQVVDKEKDSVILYIFEDLVRHRRQILTRVYDPTDRLL